MKSVNIKLEKDSTISLCLDTLKLDKQALVFCSSKRAAESVAEKVAKQLSNKKASSKELIALSSKLKSVLQNPTKQCKRLGDCMEYGIAFHHAGLTYKQRELLEDKFREGVVKIICSTPTLCLSKDSNIWSGISETKISNLKSEKSVSTLVENNIKPIKCQEINKQFNKSKLIEITSVSNYKIKVTQNHKMFIKRDGKSRLICARAILKTDKIATVGKINISKTKLPKLKEFVKDNDLHIENIKFDENICYFLGAMLGDGYSGAEFNGNSIIYKGSPCIVGMDEEVFDVTKQIMKTWDLNYRQNTNFHGTKQVILSKHKWFREFLVRCGVEKRDKKHINDSLMFMKLDLISALLRGLFDTDGHVHKLHLVGFDNISKKLITQMQKLLLRFGIISRIRKRTKGPMTIYGKTYTTVPSYELVVNQKKSILDFHKFIGFNIVRKQKDLNNLVYKINSNIHYVECKHCNYKIYRDLFNGRSKIHKEWGKLKFKVLTLLGKEGDLASKELTKKLGFIPRKKETRLNHHYELISKRKQGNREWLWSLKPIGKYIYKNYSEEHQFNEFFNQTSCPICNSDLKVKIKNGWRTNDFEGDIFWDVIRNVKEVPTEEEVYDLVLPNKPTNNHLFVANGFLVHNSAGLDLPAFRAIIRDMKRFTSRGMVPIPVLEYFQMAGRAGRPGQEDYGEAIIIANTQEDIKYYVDNYLNGKPEEIYSKLAVEPVLRMYVLSLISSEKIRNLKELYGFFDKTFYAFQFGDIDILHGKLDMTVEQLRNWRMLEGAVAEGFISGDKYGLEKQLKSTILGKRVSEIYIDPLTAHMLLQNLAKISETDSAENNFIKITHLLTCALEMRPLLNVKKSEITSIEEEFLKYSVFISEEDFTKLSTEDYEKTMKTTLFFKDWAGEISEDKLLEKYNIRPGEIHVKLNIVDWLLYACSELSRLEKNHHLIKIIKHTRIRLKEGVKSELIPLLRFKGVGRVRARALFNANIKNVANITDIENLKLSQLVGPKLAVSLKDQVGITIELVKTTKKESLKSAQISLGDFM